MASDIKNTATVLNYSYYTGDRKKTGGPISDYTINQYLIPSVNLEKVCSVVNYPDSEAADIHEPIKLHYKVYNNSGAAINFTTVTIEDAILTSPFIEIIPNTEDGGTHSGNIITVDVGAGLAAGKSAEYEIQIKNISPIAPSNILQTTALATFMTETAEKNLDEDSCDLEYNHAQLTILKENNPKGVVTYDQNIQYTITIANIGNVSATIEAGDFQDLIPENTEFVSLDNDGGGKFIYSSDAPAQIKNGSQIVLEADQSIQCVFTVKTLVQS